MEKNNEIVELTLTKIYAGVFEDQDIDNLNLTEWEKDLVMLAYYEKNYNNKALSLIKSLKTKYKDDYKKLKSLNYIQNKFSKNLFDISKYTKVLNCKINFDIIADLKNNHKENNNKPSTVSNVANTTITQIEKKKDNIDKNRFIMLSGTKTNTRYNQIQTQTNNNINKEVVINIKRIKDLLPYETLEIKKTIYNSMIFKPASDVIKAWDIFEDIINKPITDEKAIAKVLYLYQKISNKEVDIDSHIKKLIKK